jgi:hypothetical protein
MLLSFDNSEEAVACRCSLSNSASSVKDGLDNCRLHFQVSKSSLLKKNIYI